MWPVVVSFFLQATVEHILNMGGVGLWKYCSVPHQYTGFRLSLLLDDMYNKQGDSIDDVVWGTVP
jgi:hypothetical protein